MLKIHGERTSLKIPKGLGGKRTLMKGPLDVKIASRRSNLYGLKWQPIPIHDYLNFKEMASNEILVNLENHLNFANSELIGGLIELANRDKKQEFDWNTHPITVSCLNDVKKRLGTLSTKHLAQTLLILERLRITDAELWQSSSVHVLRLLHRFKARDFAHFLDVFDRDVLDDEGEPMLLSMHKTNDVFFERVVGLLPMYVKKMTNHQVVRCLEVMVHRNIGS